MILKGTDPTPLSAILREITKKPQRALSQTLDCSDGMLNLKAQMNWSNAAKNRGAVFFYNDVTGW